MFCLAIYNIVLVLQVYGLLRFAAWLGLLKDCGCRFLNLFCLTGLILCADLLAWCRMLCCFAFLAFRMNCVWALRKVRYQLVVLDLPFAVLLQPMVTYSFWLSFVVGVAVGSHYIIVACSWYAFVRLLCSVAAAVCCRRCRWFQRGLCFMLQLVYTMIAVVFVW